MARRSLRLLPLALALALLLALLALAVASVRAEDNTAVAAAAAAATSTEQTTDGASTPASTDAAATPAAAASEPATPPPKNAEPINLGRSDWCRACHSVVEEFQKWTVGNFVDPSRRANRTMSRGELVEWFCRTGAFARFKEPVVWGCIKTVQDHHDEVLAPFLGSHTSHEYTTLSKVYHHKIESCVKVDACDPPGPSTLTRSKSDCESCDRLVRDMHWALNRENVVNETVVHLMLSQVCMETGMRHARPMEIEAFCHEHVDEHWKALTRMLVKVWNDPNTPAWDRVHQMKKRFCGGMTEACEEERRQLEAERKTQKEQEREQRLAARRAKAAAAADAKAKASTKEEL